MMPDETVDDIKKGAAGLLAELRKGKDDGDSRKFGLWESECMIILITGASHTGKTALAQRLPEKYKYPYLSIDHLKTVLIRSENTALTPLSDDKALTAYLWPIVREIIKTAVENEQNLIVEGCYIPFEWTNLLIDEEYRIDIEL